MARDENVKVKNDTINLANLNELLHQVKAIGVREDVSDYLRDRVKSGYEFFSLKYYERIENSPDTLGGFLLFGKLEDGKYILPNYRANLYHPMDIDHVEIPGIDTKDLEKRMSEFNWEYDLHEKEDEWTNAVKEAYEIEETLRALSRHPDGELIAVQLWNNHVPLEILDKPGFITKIEDKLKLYPSLNFSATTPLTEAYAQLKKYQEIERGFSRCDIDDLKHKQTKAFIIHKLIKDQECRVSIPVSPPLSELINHYHVIEHSHPGHQVFEEGHETMTLAVKESYDEAMNVLKSETEKAKTDWTRKGNDFAIIGEEVGKTLRLSIDARPIKNSSVLVAVAQTTQYNEEKAYRVTVINDPITTRHHEELFIRYDQVNQEIKFFNSKGEEYKQNKGKYLEKVTNSNIKDSLIPKNKNNDKGSKKMSF